MRFLIIDESSEFRRELADMLRAGWPGAQVDDWDPRRQGSPAEVLARESYSAVLLDSILRTRTASPGWRKSAESRAPRPWCWWPTTAIRMPPFWR